MTSTRLTARAAQPRGFSPAKQLGFAALLLITFFMLFAGRAQAQAYSQIVVFGDSLSDTGNVTALTNGFIPLPPYFPGRFSNGPIWVETLASNLGLSAAPALDGGTNYAFGGAATGTPPGSSLPTLIDQMGFYLAGDASLGLSAQTPDPSALYVVWGGGNDVRAGDSSASVNNLSTIISTLAGLGATNFLVPNLPDIGITPESLALGAPTSTDRTAATLAHNAALASALTGLRMSTGATIFELDVFAFLNDVIANPGTFGFTNTTDACYDGPLGLGGPGNVCANPDEYVFWDGIHPTAAAYTILGELASTTIIPVPAAVWLFASALGILGWTRRRTA